MWWLHNYHLLFKLCSLNTSPRFDAWPKRSAHFALQTNAAVECAQIHGILRFEMNVSHFLYYFPHFIAGSFEMLMNFLRFKVQLTDRRSSLAKAWLQIRDIVAILCIDLGRSSTVFHQWPQNQMNDNNAQQLNGTKPLVSILKNRTANRRRQRNWARWPCRRSGNDRDADSGRGLCITHPLLRHGWVHPYAQRI